MQAVPNDDIFGLEIAMDDFARSLAVKIVHAPTNVLSPVDHLAKTQL